MLILQVKATLTPNAGGGMHYNYPPGYDAEKINVLSYEHVGAKADIEQRKFAYEYLIGLVKEEDAAQFLASDDIIELTQVSAIEKGRRWRPQVDKIVDNTKVLLILAKKARGDLLVPEDIDALDPENAVVGINRSELFDDLLARHL